MVALYVGIDWADRKHDVSVRTTAGERITRKTIAHTPEALSEWVGELREIAGGGKVAIGLEQSKGPLIWNLMQYEFIELHPINPKSLARYRESLYPSCSKDDPMDADLAVEFIRKHPEQVRTWKPGDVLTRKLQILTPARRKFVDQSTRLANRMTAMLKEYFPQALELFDDIKSGLACDLLEQWPNLQKLRRAKRETIRTFYTSRNCRSAEAIDKRLSLIKDAEPITNDAAIIEAYSCLIPLLAGELRLVLADIDRIEEAIAAVFGDHPKRQIFESFKGAGKALAPRLAALFGTDELRWESAASIQCFAGVAPVTIRSGRSHQVHWRWACPKFLRQTAVEFAAQTLRYSAWAHAYYRELTDVRGKSRHAALRSLAYKWLRVLYRCWTDNQPYDEQRYLESLKRRNSWLVAKIAIAS